MGLTSAPLAPVLKMVVLDVAGCTHCPGQLAPQGVERPVHAGVQWAQGQAKAVPNPGVVIAG